MVYSEFTVGKINLLRNGEMKLLEINGIKALLYRNEDKYYATGAVCTHYGGPLEEGYLDGNNIVCPWHQSCFNIKNGNRVEPPALDPVLSYEVFLKGEKIIIKLPEETEAVPTIKSGLSDTTDVRNFLIIGGGAAGCMAAITLREKGFMGNVTIITRENRTPYDRPNLSKDFLAGNAKPEWMPLRSDDFYEENRIKFLLNQQHA